MKKLILDMDTGVDDALGIALAVAADASEEIELIGITTCYGNVSNVTAVRNSLSILSILGKEEVPVFRGADRPLNSDKVYEATPACIEIHGHNGVGDADFPVSHVSADSRDSVDFILEAAEKYGSDLVLVPTGPLTNIAYAIQRDKDMVAKIGRIVLMGGALTVRGNVSLFAEANISNDPEAAKIVLESGIPMTMVGLDVTHKTRIYRADTERWRQIGYVGKLFADMTDYYIDFNDHEGCSLHDPLAVAEGIWPGIISTTPFTIEVETEGVARGQTRAVSYPDEGESDHVNVGLSVSRTAVPLIKQMIWGILAAAESKRI